MLLPHDGMLCVVFSLSRFSWNCLDHNYSHESNFLIMSRHHDGNGKKEGICRMALLGRLFHFSSWISSRSGCKLSNNKLHQKASNLSCIICCVLYLYCIILSIVSVFFVLLTLALSTSALLLLPKLPLECPLKLPTLLWVDWLVGASLESIRRIHHAVRWIGTNKSM